MTNKDKYLKDGVDVDGLSKQIATYLIPYYKLSDTAKVYEDLVDFFRKPIKPTLSEDEKVILRNIKPYTHIRRDQEGDLRTYRFIENSYTSGHSMSEFNHLFKFIQERRRIYY